MSCDPWHSVGPLLDAVPGRAGAHKSHLFPRPPRQPLRACSVRAPIHEARINILTSQWEQSSGATKIRRTLRAVTVAQSVPQQTDNVTSQYKKSGIMTNRYVAQPTAWSTCDTSRGAVRIAGRGAGLWNISPSRTSHPQPPPWRKCARQQPPPTPQSAT